MIDQATWAPPTTPPPPPLTTQAKRTRGLLIAGAVALGVLALIVSMAVSQHAPKPLSSTAQVYAVSINAETTCSGITELRNQFADSQAAAVRAMNSNIKAGGDGGLPYETASDIAAVKPLIDARVKALCG